jgi:hypothetical protein
MSFYLNLSLWTCKNYVLVLCLVIMNFVKLFASVMMNLIFFISIDVCGCCIVICHFVDLDILSYASRLFSSHLSTSMQSLRGSSPKYVH